MRHKQSDFKSINYKHGLMSSTKACASGNKKLPMSHMIFNMTSAMHCPAAELGQCAIKDACYARDEENRWTSVRNNRAAIEDWFKTANVEQVVGLVEDYYLLYSREYPITHIRLSEAGDFPDQRAVEVMNLLAEYMHTRYGVVTYAWSARKDLDFGQKKFILNGSSIHVHNSNRTFLATGNERFMRIVLKSNEARCAGDCRICHICHSENEITTVYCNAHGHKKKLIR